MSACVNAGRGLSKGPRLCSNRASGVLPFLYQTATIRRYYSDLEAPPNEKASTVTPRAPRTPRFSNAPRASRAAANARRDRKDFRTTPVEDPNQDFVPFESADGTPESVIPVSTKPSTMTETERKAFEQLEALAASPRSRQSKAKSQVNMYTSLDAVLNEAISNIELSGQQNEGKRPSRRSDELDSTKAANDPRIRVVRSTRKSQPQPPQEESEPFIVTQLRSARTDLELWSVLEKEVFNPIASLNLDTNPSDASSAVSKQETYRRRIVMKNFPRNLTTAASILRTDFPTSNLVLSFLPTLRSLGPSAFALGATPKLYNQIITFLFEKHSDIDSVNGLLAEMEREVIEPNATTLKLLDYMVTIRQRVHQGGYGIAIKTVWGTEKFRRGFDALARWRGRVEKILLEQEIRAERRKKAVETEEEAEAAEAEIEGAAQVAQAQ